MHNTRNSSIHFPADLTIWMGERILASQILDVTSELVQGLLHSESPNSRWHGFCPQVLLRLLTYCYATGVFSSNEIAERASKAGMVRTLSGYTLPDEQLLKAFRRRWRPFLRQSLTGLFNVVWRNHNGAACSPDISKVMPEAHCRMHDLLRFFEEEAEQRINQAIQLDSAEADV